MEKVFTSTFMANDHKRIFVNTVIFYVAHSKQVYLHSNSPLKKDKIMKCENLLYELKLLLNVTSFTEIKRTVYRFKQKLFDILPHEENLSYKSSLEKFNNIIEFINYKNNPAFLFT